MTEDDLNNGPYDRYGAFGHDPDRQTGTIRKFEEERFEAFVSECAAMLVQRIGADKVRGILLGGSFALGEGSVYLDGDDPVFLSDVDLLVILDSVQAHRKVLPERQELGEACERLLPGACFIGRVDVGTVLAEELPAFPRSPGVYVLRNSGKVLHGDRSLLELLPGFAPEEIPPVEALTLLENRMASFLGSWKGRGAESREDVLAFLYGVCRCYTDTVVALHVVSGSFSSGYRQRMRDLEREAGAGRMAGTLGDGLLSRAAAWTRFKIEPAPLIPGSKAGDGDSLWLEAASDLVEVWEECFCAIYGTELDVTGRAAVATLAPVRDEGTAARDRYRAWKEALRILGPKQRRAAIRYAGKSALRATPLGLVRSAALHLCALAVEHGTGHPPAKDPGGFPFDGRDWPAAAASCNGWWSRLVFGREA